MSTKTSEPTSATGRSTGHSSGHSFGFDLGCNLRLGASRLKYEVRAYFRRGGTVFFTFRWIRKDS
jgi:hypothetical protein